MEKKKWGDIPPLEGLEMDWDYQPQSANGQRAHKRMTLTELSQLFGSQRFEVQVATTTATVSGSLRDLCENGLAVDLPTRLDEYQNLKVGMMLGREKIIARAQVRHVQRRDHHFTTGLMFVGLDVPMRQYIAGIYASKVLRHSI
ncbi:type IV pilus assembly PilZ [Desulfobulbus propionicus DSM 2032]|uniref:Type IV pilus assembly PilZ n=1 Tax=Desulfobulbus propionicus (strain ATCC 33891 / DSM 2032 / VKM B-1956 / 1pr3) TaxID=577650 RepID=A0A7U3YNM1_DESPD|nr:PilZ domain-containing protein [Desulfobulbus propionicus]ADW18704.1 type IV pilus assembly PilZ [Desulfobulbus propionicus DSM 2032]